MLSQSQIKHITSLRVKKFRDESGLFVAEGEKLVQELMHSRYRVAEVYAPAAWIIANLPQLQQLGVKATETLPREMERISGLTTPSPVLAVVEIPISTSAHHHISTLPHHHIITLTLVLDDIRDPGNLGTIVRIAHWFGIGEGVCSEHTVDLYNPKVVQATMGSITRVRVEYRNLQAWLEELGGQCPVYGAFLQGENLYSEPLGTEGIIVIGNESRGISKNLEPFITRKIFIPAFGTGAGGRAESLNASVATAVICAEFRRREMMQ